MQGIIEVERDKMASYLGHLVERIAIDYILANHRSIVKEIYPNQSQSDHNNIQVLRTNPESNGYNTIGDITGKKGSWLVHGWNGDLVLILHDDKYGKRAIVFEIKFGKIHISNSQQKFFTSASLEIPSKFMSGLKDLKIFIFHCQYFDRQTNKITFYMFEYMPKNLKEFFKAKDKIVFKNQQILPVIEKEWNKPEITGKKKKKKKKPRRVRLSISGLKKYRKKKKKGRNKPVKKKRSLKVESRRQERRKLEHEVLDLDMDDDIYDIEQSND